MSSKKTFYIYHLHIFNLFPILFLKILGDVRVFKYKGLCKKLLNSQVLPVIGDFKDVDHWRRTKESAFDQLKPHQANINNKNDSVFLQYFFKEFEQYVFFIELAKSQSQKPMIVSSHFMRYLQKNFPQLLLEQKIQGSFFYAMDLAQIRLEKTITLIKHIVKLMFKDVPFSFKHYKYLITGIGVGEYPTSENSLNFSWPALNKVIEPHEALFILDVAPTGYSKSYLQDNKINYVTKRQLIASLSALEKLRIICIALKSFFALSDSFEAHYRFNSLLSNSTWLRIFKILNPTHFIFSFSAGWPELYEVSVANTLNIKTIKWFYGTSEFGYSNQYSPFSDKNVRLSVHAASELWIWNDLLKQTLSDRSLALNTPRIEVVGPILNGDWSPLQQQHSPSVFKIALFDIVPMKPHIRLQHGEGPYCNAEMQEKIYASLVKMHQMFQNIQFIIKTKRAVNPDMFDPLPSLEYLQHKSSDRILMRPANHNPYEIIAEADFVISTPYTSPTVLALQLGKPGVFYDPIGISQHTYMEAFKNLTIHSEFELFEIIKQAVAGTFNVDSQFKRNDFPLITPQQILQNLKSRL